MTKGKWYKIDVGQEMKSDGQYYWFVEINDVRYHEARNDKPAVFENIGVWASNPADYEAISTNVRNFKFKTEQDGIDDWYVVDGQNCWQDCGSKGGQCNWCGPTGYCCHATKHDINGDCTTGKSFNISKSQGKGSHVTVDYLTRILFFGLEMESAIQNSQYANSNIHMCVAKKPEDQCIDWTVTRDRKCPGGDLEGPHHKECPEGDFCCRDFCLQYQPDCKHYSYRQFDYGCWIKKELNDCVTTDEGFIIGTRVHYDCRDNHNCGGSYVQIQV